MNLADKVTNRHILEAARCVRVLLLVANQGQLPRCVSEWERLCTSLGIPVTALTDCPTEFTARLFHDERVQDGWLIAYNALRPARQSMRFLCHEVSEWLAVINDPGIFDDLPQRVYHYTGGSDPDDARHKIAKHVEELCFRRS